MALISKAIMHFSVEAAQLRNFVVDCKKKDISVHAEAVNFAKDQLRPESADP